jgi:2-keto-4-pentenoate hydratase/2-oxohepta-3-ene-1,7-dioic acid hydratase in catechol pathway
MKLVRYGPPGREKPGLIDPDGIVRDLSPVVPDIGPGQLSPASLARLARLDPGRLKPVRRRPRFGVPVAGSTKFIAIGLNYSDHAAETGNPIPKEPVVFHKTLSSMCGANDDVMLPKGSKKTDWEVELGIIIGTRARCVPAARGMAHIAGYAVINDLSEREFQLERGGTWDKGKGCDTFGPIGPWLVTAEEVPDPQRLAMWLDVNGRPRQRGNTNTMVFRCGFLVSYLSRFMTLNPGDVITTGTPPGVGMSRKPPQFLKPGDVVTLGIEGVGEQRQTVVRFRP